MTCANCEHNAGMVYASMPPRYRCAITKELHLGHYACNVEFAPVKHGRWLIHNILDYAKRPTGRKVGECSICGQLTPDFRLITEEPNWSYCPNCGARMDEVENETT